MLLGYINIEKSKFKWALINLKNISNLIKIKIFYIKKFELKKTIKYII